MNKLFVVGIGPGGPSGMTLQARQALAESELLCGYTEYIRLVAPLFPDKETLATPMLQEVERCHLAFARAAKGQTTALVCSGDAGVYGMAGPVLQMADVYPQVEVEIVAGVTAAMSGAALLGAPLMHDFAVISLSDLLTPWSLIEKRLEAVALADFCLCLYNPRSKKRQQHLARACAILQRHKSAQTVCGWVRNIDRAGQASGILRLAELAEFEADMFTTIFVGNSATRLLAGRMVTPRGYEELA